MLCCNRLLLLKQALWLRIARSMCDGRPFASSPFRRMASRGLSFLCGLLFFVAFASAFCLCRFLSLHDKVPRCREITQTQCSRPHGTRTCHLHTFGFGKCQPILAQAQHSSEPDMVCHSLLFQPYDVLSSRTFSHERPLAQPGGLFHVQLEHSPSHEDANRDRPEDAQFGLPHQRVLWDHSARDTCFHIPSGGLRCISWNTRGFFGFTCFLTTVQGTEAYLPHTAKNNHFSSLQEPHGKDSCKLFRYYSLNSCLFWYIHSEQCTCRWTCYPHP